MIHPAVAELEQALRQLLLPLPESTRVLVGYSGGLDSTALLFIASRVVPAAQLCALHINHNLQSMAEEWESHCRQQAQALGVKFNSVHVYPNDASENAAREARYSVFESTLGPGDLLLLGHHMDDQAETLLMRLFRGAGARGLSGIPQRRQLGVGSILRPLLATTRDSLESIVKSAGLSWVEDPSNRDPRYLRNWIRQSLGPALSQCWPDWVSRLSESAELMSESAKLHRALALVDADGQFSNPLKIPFELAKEPERLANLIYYWLNSHAVRVGSRSQLLGLVQTLSENFPGGSGRWLISDQAVHLYQGSLWLESVEIPPQAALDLVLVPGEVDLACGKLGVESGEIGLPQGLDVQLRGRQPGDKVRLAVGHQSVKKFMNEKKIPPWLRDSWPLLVHQGEIISIVGVWTAKSQHQPGGLTLKWVR